MHLDITDMKKVSIILPVFNTGKYLQRCIESLLAQSYANIEIIAVNDGSTDDSTAILKELSKGQEKLKIIEKENGGLSSARKSGFKIAKGEYIIFIDSDDYVHKNMINKLVYALESNSAGLAICGYNLAFENTGIIKKIPFEDRIIEGKEAILEQYIYPHIGYLNGNYNIQGFMWQRLMKRELIHESYFVSEREYFKEDCVFNLLYADNLHKIVCIKENLYMYAIRENSLCNQYRNNKIQMDIKLYDFFIQYFKDRNITIPVARLESFVRASILGILTNAAELGAYNDWSSTCKLLKEYGWLQKQGICKSIIFKLIAIIISCKQYALLLIFFKAKKHFKKLFIKEKP